TETVLTDTVTRGAPVSGLEGARIVDVPVRDKDGRAFSSAEVSVAIAAHAETAISEERHALVHVVHGSKTGLTLPALAETGALRQRHAAGGRRLPGAHHQGWDRRICGSRGNRFPHRIQIHGRASVRRLRDPARGCCEERSLARGIRHAVPPRRVARGVGGYRH